MHLVVKNFIDQVLYRLNIAIYVSKKRHQVFWLRLKSITSNWTEMEMAKNCVNIDFQE